MAIAYTAKIDKIEPHGNADSLVISRIGSYQAITRKDQYKEGQTIVFIEPDTLLPKGPAWTEFYLSKNSRVRTIKLRGVFSQGIVEALSTVGLPEDTPVGEDVAERLGIVHYDPVQCQNLDAKPGGLPFGMFKTDESNWRSQAYHEPLPIGEPVTITLKVDGSSGTYFCRIINEGINLGITSRQMNLKLDADNAFTKLNTKYGILEKLKAYCAREKCSLALRGEVYGNGIQKSKINPHSRMESNIAFFNVLNLETLKYLPFSECEKICQELELPLVPILERDVIFARELIDKYENVETVNGLPFEGVVVKKNDGSSFKIINKVYDSQK
jgi:RNA ligase (TIGR02306 family)